MISDYRLRDTKPSNYMIEHENCSCLAVCLKCRHRLGPLGKIIYRKDDIRTPPGRVRVTCNKIDTPFGKRTPRNFSEGDLVLVYDQANDKLGAGKFVPMWHGPYVVKRKLAKGAYELVDFDGDSLGKPRNGLYLKRYYA